MVDQPQKKNIFQSPTSDTKSIATLFENFKQTKNPSLLKTYTTIQSQTAQDLLKQLSKLDLNNQLYNIHHYLLLLQNDYLIDTLTIDTLEQIFYPFDPSAYESVLSFREQLQSTILTRPTDNENIRSILSHTAQGGNTIILMNHPTYFTPGIMIGLLETLNTTIPNLNTNLYTILGGAIMTNNQRRLAQGISNILKTHPQTENGIIPEIKAAQEKAIFQFIRSIIEIYNKPSDYGKIFLIAPTATRDTIERKNPNCIINKQIFISDDDSPSVQKTLNLVNKITNSNTMILLAGVNESELKNPHYINPSNNEWRTDCIIPIHTQLYTPDNLHKFQTLHRDKEVMKTIASLIVNEDQEIIGQTLCSNELRSIKNNRRTTNADL